MRIQKYLSQQKILSRREAEQALVEGKIKVNGKVVKELGTQIDPGKDKVVVALPKGNSGKITIAINKPRNIVCSKNNEEGETIFELFPQFNTLNTVGRLDKDSEGLILLSNDGVVTALITGRDHLIEKEYEVETREKVGKWHIRHLEQGIKLEDGMTLPAKAALISDHKFSLILKEGRKHQIRRMANALQLTIGNLKRVRIGNIKLGNLKVGASRTLTAQELADLKQSI
ncbi:MAG: pseudouridine synthase [Patescibacteria group bacterium]